MTEQYLHMDIILEDRVSKDMYICAYLWTECERLRMKDGFT